MRAAIRAARRGLRATGILTACFLLPQIATPAGARGEETTRTLAVWEFAVYAPGARAGETAWLGVAIAELLQAKMQHFRGARALERSRLVTPGPPPAPLADGADAVPGDLLAISPAEVLVFGSVEVAAAADAPERVKVRARAVETATGAVISDAVFSGTTDLAGLLQVAEALAKALADGLGFAYTPGQLAYAEPERIGALRDFVEGAAHAAAGRQRAAIEAFQRALDGNGGKYYPAAHRAQAAAFRALAAALADDDARRVREEYLAKFKADALLASGALFDLAQAYEANGLWREAIRAYDDYVSALGREGQIVRWTFSPAGDGGFSVATAPFPAVSEGGRIHLCVKGTRERPGFWWVTLDADSGAPLRTVSLLDALGLQPDEAAEMRLFAADAERVSLYWYRRKKNGNYYFGDAAAGALAGDGRLLWKVTVGGERGSVRAARARGDRLFLLLGDGRLEVRGSELVTVDASTGAIVSRVAPRVKNFSKNHASWSDWLGSIEDVDPVRSLLYTPAGRFDLETGGLVADGAEPRGQIFAGVSGVTGTEAKDGVRLFRDHVETLAVRDARFTPPGRLLDPGDWIVLERSGHRGPLAVDPADWSVLDAYRDTPFEGSFLGQDPEHLYFLLQNDPAKGGVSGGFGVSSTDPGVVVNVVSKRRRALAAKHFIRQPSWITLAGGGAVTWTGGSLLGLALAPGEARAGVPAVEAHLGVARCAWALGEAALAAARLERFEAEHPSDPRAPLLRMKIARGRGDREAAAGFALRALASGGLDADDLPVCLDAVRGAHPEVRDVLLTPVRGRLLFRSMTRDGKLVCTVRGPASGKVHFVIDASTGGATVAATPEYPGGGHYDEDWARYLDGSFYFFSPFPWRWQKRAVEVVGIDLLTGERRRSGQMSGESFVRGLPLAVSRSERGGGFLLNLDPETLRETSRLDLGGFDSTPYVSDDVLVFPSWSPERFGMGPFRERGTERFLVVDRDGGAEIARRSVDLEQERVVAVHADAHQLFVGVNGARVTEGDALAAEARLRVVSLPNRPGGASWTFTAEGLVAGNIVLEEGRVAFPAFLGKLPTLHRVSDAPSWRRETCRNEELVLGLSRVSLDRRTGDLLGVEPLPGAPGPVLGKGRQFSCDAKSLTDLGSMGHQFTPPGPRTMLAGSGVSSRREWNAPEELWPAPGDGRPLAVAHTGAPADYHIVAGDFSTAGAGWRDEFLGYATLQLETAGTVYESIGGGTILVKDLAGGQGLERVVADSLMPTRRYE